MLIGYMRVSKNNGSQILDLQRDALIAAGVQEDRIYQDSTSGKNEDRPGLQNCLKALQKGNTLVVWKLDRLGRDLKHLVTIIDDLRKRDIGFKVLAGQGAQIDTTTSNGRLVFGMFASIAEFERELIIERTNAGLESARARGRTGGRPRKMDEPKIRTAMAALSDRKSVAAEVARTLGVTTATLYKHVNADGTLKAAGQKILNENQ
jgi:DNA invertase Pin-like site-specific DNA recombinase